MIMSSCPSSSYFSSFQQKSKDAWVGQIIISFTCSPRTSSITKWGTERTKVRTKMFASWSDSTWCQLVKDFVCQQVNSIQNPRAWPHILGFKLIDASKNQSLNVWGVVKLLRLEKKKHPQTEEFRVPNTSSCFDGCSISFPVESQAKEKMRKPRSKDQCRSHFC